MKLKRNSLVQVKLRITKNLRSRLQESARIMLDRSISREIAERLERSFSAPELQDAVAEAVVKKLKLQDVHHLLGGLYVENRRLREQLSKNKGESLTDKLSPDPSQNLNGGQ